MTEENRKDILFIAFIVAVIMLAVIYFSVPERALFFENQLKWWGEFRDTFLGFRG
jgi:hypothetical protein